MQDISDRAAYFTVSTGSDAGPQAYLNADQRGGTGPNGKPSMTIDQAGLHLVGGEPGWSSALGVAYTVTYAFRSTAPSSMPEDAGGFSRFNDAQIAQAELALAAWSDVANITFTRVGSGTSGEGAYSNSASILLANYSTGVDGAAAFAEYPGNPSFSSTSGDVWVNSSLSYNSNPVAGNYGALVLVHELGHAIGLSHPGEYDASDGVAITYAHDAEYYEDSNQYTVMSYFDETDTGANYRGAYAASPMLDDISAAQQEYGINTSTRTGDTVYGFNSTAGRPWFLATGASSKLIFAAWDAGGIDTFDFSGFTVAQTIELREGYFSNVGGLVGNVAVAKGAAIENAIGGSGVDTITGNALANRLLGGAGNDLLYGLAGNDILNGGEGADTLTGGLGDDAYWVDNASDVVVELTGEGFDTVAASIGYTLGANIEQLILVGAALTATGNATGNMLIGNASGNTLTGLEGNDVLSGEGGADVMVGGLGDDAYWVDNVGDTITELAGEGYDSVAAFVSYTLSANVEQLVLLGTAANGIGNANVNVLTGNALSNVLDGQAGADRLVGGLGDDAYWVDNVGDVVVELAGEGFDTIASFVSYTLAANIEQLKLVGTVALTGTGSSSANILNGNGLDNTLYGLGGDDVLAGEAGADTMIGGIGNDAYWVDNVGDIIVELSGEGFESVASSVSYTLSANVEQLVLLGTAVSATGNALGNIIVGNGLDNTITGAGGDDLLTGGAGADHFVFGPGMGHDKITDFGANGDHDTIELAAFNGTGITWTVTQQGSDTLVAFSSGDNILLQHTLATGVVQSGDHLIWA